MNRWDLSYQRDGPEEANLGFRQDGDDARTSTRLRAARAFYRLAQWLV